MGHNYVVNSFEEKLISKYCNISIFEVEELDLISFKFYLREAFVYNMMQTEEGNEYLSNAWRLDQVSPDRNQLRKNFKRSDD